MKRLTIFLAGLLLTALFPAGMVCASPPPLVLGQSSALSGPTQNLGLEMRAGLLAAFSLINDEGGVDGREIVLLSRDDGYEPDRAVRNTKRLIYQDQVFALIGAVGTPTSMAVEPIVNEVGVPFFGPFTGAEFLRTPFKRYVVNVRASYFQEMEKFASYLVEQKGITRIACFYQNDSYGSSGLEGIKRALARRGMELVATGSYERNTVAVMGALRDIYREAPEAVVLVGAYSACAEFIKLSKNKIDKDIIFCNISFVGTESLRQSLGAYGENVVVSQVVPHPRDQDIALIREYQRAMGKYQHDAPISFTTLEGYIVGRLFGAIARAVEGELSRENFITTMEQTGTFDLGGLVLQFGPDDHQGMDTIYLTHIYPLVEKLPEEQ
ncbi:MAG: ABC transporter substrate-binding protein [Desulforhopalus sp.]|jgi:ABC-type branched-subunit amino acid transport system substrate-binding protein|nr:ABC transporter substrate-binding protein [Desulforhopalus sp.]